MRRVICLTGLGAAFALLSAIQLHAICVMTGPACAEYWRAKIVFDGVVEGWDEVERGHLDQKPIPARLVHFRVAHAWKGLAPDTQAVGVVTLGGRGLWVEDQWEFKKGQRYLVWAYPTDRPGEFATSRCSLTTEIERAADDVAFLASLAQPATGGRIFGTVTRVETVVRPDGYRKPEPVPGVKVRIEGGSASRDTSTDAAGRYEFGRLDPGHYTVAVSVPAPLSVRGEQRPVEVPDVRGCALADFYARTDGVIGGVVLGADGLPVDHMQLEAVLADVYDAAPQTIPGARAATDAAGRFGFEGLPPGRYVVGVNLHMGPSDYSPWPRLLHPGTVARESATVVELAAGQHVDIGVMRMPTRLQRVEVSGTLAWPDGKPASNITIGARCTLGGRYAAARGTRTDVAGRFTIELMETLFCEFRATAGEAGKPAEATARLGPLVITRAPMPPVRMVLTPTVQR
jgi:hypothetical protein